MAREWSPEEVRAATPFADKVSEQRIVEFPELVLESGEVLARPQVAFRTWGDLSSQGDNALVVCHALTGSADVSDWWGPLLGAGRVFDPRHFFIVCCNILASPYGTSSPVTRNPATGKPYGADFPHTTIRDNVALHRMVLDYLGVRRVQVVIGGSLGGMAVLEWALMMGDYVRAVVPIATSARNSAWCISWSESQRQAIYCDPQWQNGRYSLGHPPLQGLAAARMAAMLTYRTRDSFEARFGRSLQAPRRAGPPGSPAAPPYDPAKDLFSAQSYLRYQGDKFKGRFDANCFVRITQSMDSHDVGAGRGDVAAALGSIAQPALVIGIKSDGLFMLQEQRELAELIPNARLVEIDSPDGHDGFLLEFGEMNKVIRRWLRETLPDLFDGHLHDGGGAEDGVVDDDGARASVAGEGWGDWDAHVAAVTAGAPAHVLT